MPDFRTERELYSALAQNEARSFEKNFGVCCFAPIYLRSMIILCEIVSIWRRLLRRLFLWISILAVSAAMFTTRRRAIRTAASQAKRLSINCRMNGSARFAAPVKTTLRRNNRAGRPNKRNAVDMHDCVDAVGDLRKPRTLRYAPSTKCSFTWCKLRFCLGRKP